MKRLLFCILALLIAFNLYAEDKKKIFEIGLNTTQPLQSTYNVSFKWGDENSMIRLSSLSATDYIRKTEDIRITGGDTTTIGRFDLSSSMAFALGKEFKKELDNNFEFRYGMDFTFSYSVGIDDDVYDTVYTFYNKSSSLSPGFQLVFGINYLLKDHIVFGVEVLPKFYYSYTKYDYVRDFTDPLENDQINPEYYHYWRFDLSSLARFSISYRF